MQTIYLRKKHSRLVLLLLLVLCIVIVFVRIMLPPPVAPTMVEPFRQGAGGEQLVSLAINVDWGEEYLPDILAVLAEHNVQVSFFLTGRWANNNSELAAQIAAAGHEIGNHGYSHASPNNSSYDEIKAEIFKTEQAIERATGIKTTLYAPPSGESDAHVLQAAADSGYITILWSVDTIDWQRPSAATIIERVTGKIHDGAIILAHPTAPTLEALPTILRDLQTEGYRFVPVSENIGL